VNSQINNPEKETKMWAGPNKLSTMLTKVPQQPIEHWITRIGVVGDNPE